MVKGNAPPADPAAAAVGGAAFRALADASEDAVFLTDRRGRYLAVNARFARWVGRAPAEILGRTPPDLWPAEAAAEEVRDGLRALGGERVEREAARPCGAEARRARVERIPVRGEDGAVCAVLGLFRDVTPAPDRRHAERLELLGRLAGGVAHDLSNLMTVVIGNAALLAESAAPERPHREMLAAIEDAGGRAADLTQSLLALLRHEPAAPGPTDLNAVVEQAARLLRRTLSPRIRLAVHAQGGLPPVEAVPIRLWQLLLNLCLNARDAMPDGGLLELETAAECFDAEEARRRPERRPGAFARLSVADTGEGIPPEVEARLFDAPFTTKPPGRGAGMGLTVVLSVVRDHHGWLECATAPGRGTRFDVYLPFPADLAIRVDAQAGGRSRNDRDA